MIAQTIRNVRICRSRRLGRVFLFLLIYHLFYSSLMFIWYIVIYPYGLCLLSILIWESINARDKIPNKDFKLPLVAFRPKSKVKCFGIISMILTNKPLWDHITTNITVKVSLSYFFSHFSIKYLWNFQQFSS